MFVWVKQTLFFRYFKDAQVVLKNAAVDELSLVAICCGVEGNMRKSILCWGVEGCVHVL